MSARGTVNRDSSIFLELVRFVLIGAYATVIDYVVEVWLESLLSGWITSNPGNHLFAFMATFVIGLVGFLFGTPATWSLSAVWGFRNVEDERKGKSLKGALIFTAFAFAGLVLASIIQFLGYMTCLEWTNLNINILNINFSTLFKEDVATFWAFTIIFGLKTVVSMTFNYLTRKFIIFRAPKKKEEPAE